MKIEYYEEMLEQEAINKYLNMIANDYNGELAKIFQEKYINKDKEIERLNNIINNDNVYGYIKHLEDLITKKDSIINELEKELKDRIKNVPNTMAEVYEDKNILHKLQELKGSDK